MSEEFKSNIYKCSDSLKWSFYYKDIKSRNVNELNEFRGGITKGVVVESIFDLPTTIRVEYTDGSRMVFNKEIMEYYVISRKR